MIVIIVGHLSGSIVLYCIVFIHLYSASHSLSLSEALSTTAIDTVSEFARRSATISEGLAQGFEAELVRRMAIARNCMTSLDRHNWRSSISVSTKIRLYSAYVLPVFLYGAETWTLTKAMAAKVDAFDQWCQRRILRIHYSQHVTNAEVRRRTGCLPLSEITRSRRLNWFGHVARASPELDHRRALYAAIRGQPRDWRRRRWRPAHTWTRTVEADLKPANIGLFSAWHRAQDRTAWSGLIRTAMPQTGVRS